MGAITPSATQVESMGSMKILIHTITTGSNSDTYTVDKYAPVVSVWGQGNNGTGLPAPDITYTPSTGIFLITNGTSQVGVIQMYVLMRS